MFKKESPQKIVFDLTSCQTALSVTVTAPPFLRVVDVGSEWRTFSNDSNSNDRCRVGGAEV